MVIGDLDYVPKYLGLITKWSRDRSPGYWDFLWILGRNIVAERNTLHSLDDDVELAVHENTLIPIEEAKARKAAEEERCRRLWEESQQQSQPGLCDLCHILLHSQYVSKSMQTKIKLHSWP